MSGVGPLQERIEQVLRDHRWVAFDMTHDGCGGCGWRGISRDAHTSHVAAVVLAALELTEETERTQCLTPGCTWSFGCGHDGIRTHWVSPWVGGVQ